MQRVQGSGVRFDGSGSIAQGKTSERRVKGVGFEISVVGIRC